MGLPETPPTTPVPDEDKAKEGNFLYFAFGSNLFGDRLHISCPSAARAYPGKLSGYKLGFNYNSLRWRGHVATIIEAENESLWGCVWTISKSELEALDRQEGVHIGLYRPLMVDVTSLSGHTVQVRTYQMAIPYEENPLPSVVYKRVMLAGAQDSNLPDEYITYMKNIPDNGYDGVVDVQCNLKYRQDAEKPHSQRPPGEFPDEPTPPSSRRPSADGQLSCVVPGVTAK